jgi:predicted metallo-beta-lactamase superfamily hydrolase
LEYEEKAKAIMDQARSMGKIVTTAAEYLGQSPDILEARRREIHEAERSYPETRSGLT